MGVIYMWVCLVNWKVYIGSAVDEKKRKRQHETGNNSNEHLQRAINKYGIAHFHYVVLHNNVPYEKLEDMEIEAIAKYNCNKCSGGWGYNETDGGNRGSLGHKKTPEQIAKTSGENNGWYGKGYLQSGENNPFYGCKHTPETIARISGKNHHMYGKTGENAPFYGHKHTPETIARISALKSGKNNPLYGKKRPEQSDRMSGKNNPMHGLRGENHPAFGYKHTPEQRAKRSGQNNHKARPEYTQAKCFFFLCVAPMETSITEKREQVFAEYPDIPKITLYKWIRKWLSEVSTDTDKIGQMRT